MKLRIAVCDDEEEILKKESCMIKEILDDKNIKYQLDEYISPKKLLSSQILYDMVFLDIEMDSFNGIDVGAKLMQRKNDSYIFFITNYPYGRTDICQNLWIMTGSAAELRVL